MSLTLSEARARAQQISDVQYAVDLDLTDPSSGHFGCRTTVRFGSTGPGTFLELADATDLQVTVGGAPVDAAYDGRRIPLTGLADQNEVVVEARLPFVTDGDGMHTFTDPADGETYLSAYVGMDVAQRVFACFDQNDLKATLDLTVSADPEWTVLGNGRLLESEAGRWRFATTLPIPVAMFVVCAGPWHSRTWEHAGLPFGWHARRSLAAELDRDFEDLQRVTAACFDHYAALFTEPYPFDSFDQAFVPGQNWGALETPGCVTYRDEYLPRGRLTDLVRIDRSSTIAHEMAHMWFGNLVTMTWWEDTWLQESFADYMGYRVAADALGEPRALLAGEIGRKPVAFDADLRRSTHPIAPAPEDVPDVDSAANNFDMISYAKGNAALRQLVTWLGDETFLAGLNAYLTRHRLGNATLADFVAALDAVSERDVHDWAERWLRTTGFDTIRVTRDGDVPVLSREGSRPHRIRVTAYDDELAEVDSRFVDLGEEPVRLDEWAGRVVVPNSHGETFARLVLDDASWEAVVRGLSGIEDPLVRAVLWTAAFGMVHSRELPADDFLDLVSLHLPTERQVSIVSAVVTADPVRDRAAAPRERGGPRARPAGPGLPAGRRRHRRRAGQDRAHSRPDRLDARPRGAAALAVSGCHRHRRRARPRTALDGCPPAGVPRCAGPRGNPGRAGARRHDRGRARRREGTCRDPDSRGEGGSLGAGRRRRAGLQPDAARGVRRSLRPGAGRPRGAVRRRLSRRGAPPGRSRTGLRPGGAPRVPGSGTERGAADDARARPAGRPADGAAPWLGGPARRPALTQVLRMPVEHRRDRAVLEDLADRAGHERGDREAGELVELALGSQRQRVGHDDLRGR